MLRNYFDFHKNASAGSSGLSHFTFALLIGHAALLLWGNTHHFQDFVSCKSMVL